jgi:hypothetical protein
VLKWDDTHSFAEVLEDGRVIRPFTAFGESQEIDVMVLRKTFQEMIGAMVGAAVERPRYIRVEGKNSHQL